MCTFLSLVVFSSALIVGTNAVLEVTQRLAYNHIGKCKSNEYFDSDFFLCKVCDVTLGLQPTLSRLSCECDATNATTVIDYDNETKLPICNTSIAEIKDRPPECPVKDLMLIPSKSIQTQHVQIQRQYSHNCSTECNTKTSIIIHNFNQEFCVQRPLINDLLPFDNFRNSNPIYANLASLTFFCQTMNDIRSCNRLANLCTLSQYTTNKLSPCNIFYASSQQSVAEMDEHMFAHQLRPSLFYKKGKNSVDYLDAILRQSYDTEANGEKNKIQFLQTRYDVHGNLQTMQSLMVNDLIPCASSPNAIHFGRNVQVTCRVGLQQLIANIDKYGAFMDVHLNYTTEVDKRSTSFLVPIPMLVREASSDNWSPDRSKWQLVNRLALVDSFSDPATTIDAKRSPSPALSHIEDLQQFKTIRIVNHIELRITLATDHHTNPNQITVPLLIADHLLVNTSSLRTSDDASLISFTFKITFAKSYGVTALIQGIFPVLLTLGIVAVALRTYRYKTRQQRLFWDVDIFVKFLVYCIGHAGDVLFGSSALVCSYVLYVYRNQSSVRVVLPVDGQELLNVVVYVAVPLKIFTVLIHMWQKCKADIFFVDWERPRTFDNHSVTKNIVETPSMRSGRKMLMYDGVSAWRTYFVANEWMRLATKRRTSMRVQMVAVIGVILIATGGCPKSSSVIFQDATMRIATSFLLYLTVYVAQRILFTAILERYFANSVQRFVDICSLANVSLFVLELETFGYYVHGRSPHGFSDTDMCSMSVHLKREEQNTFGTRGLMLNSDQQTFTLLLPPNLRVLYDRLTASMLPPSTNTSYESQLERTAAAYNNINRFLNTFIDHGLKDLDYMIQEKTIVQRLLEFENATHCTENRGVFYSDGNAQSSSFTNVLFYGNESRLFGMEIMVFVLIAGCWGEYLMGMLAVGVIGRIMRIAFGRLYKTNLAQKTLIESRFLA